MWENSGCRKALKYIRNTRKQKNESYKSLLRLTCHKHVKVMLIFAYKSLFPNKSVNHCCLVEWYTSDETVLIPGSEYSVHHTHQCCRCIRTV
jgi:hypothetical protein